MQHIDMHCDSLMQLVFKDPQNKNLMESEYTMVDFARMQKTGQMAQFFAAWLPPQRVYGMFGLPIMTDDEYIQACHDILVENVEKHSDIVGLATTADEIEANWKAGKMSAVFTIEDGRSVDGNLDNIKKYYDMGVRAMTLTWNSYNCFGAPNSKNPLLMYDGLTAFGREAIQYMQELGMLVDVSHLSEGGFFDVANIVKKPFVATHSNCRALCPHQRNLSDDQLRLLAACGGATGINFGPEFLNADVSCPDSTAALMAKHARHMANVAGVDVIAIGSDFDGIHGNLEIGSCDKMGLLEDALRAEGFTNDDIEKIFYKNVLRVMKDAVK